MIQALVRFSIRFPGVIVVLALMLVATGVFSLGRARIDVFPEFSPTQVAVQTEAPGLPAELVETRVTQPIERALAGVTGLETLRSQSIPGLSVVTVLFDEGTDIHRNRQFVAERLAALTAVMPAGVEPPTIPPLTSSASTVLGVGLTSATRSGVELRTLAEHLLRPHLLAVEGVADVNIFGGGVREWHWQIDPARLAAAGIGLDEAVAAARRAGGVLSAGVIAGPNQRIDVVTEAQARAPEQLAQVLLKTVDGHAVRLGDVGTLVEAQALPSSAAAIDGTPGVFLMVQGQLGANTLAVSRHLEAALADLRPVLERDGVTLHDRLFRPATFIETAVGNIRFDVAVGAALVVVVLFLFLYDVRTALICTTAIPVSLLGAVLVLGALDLPINIMVLGGLAIALGEVVDDAIIDTENIFRRLRENLAAAVPRPIDAVALDASIEVRGSVVYATFIVALVFVPLLTFGGIGGRLFAPLGLAYILAILSSLVVATTLTPALCLLLLGNGRLRAGDPPFVRAIRPGYEALLARIERRPARVLSITAAGIAAGLALLPLLEGEFVPSLKEGHYVVHMTAVPGTSEVETLRIGTAVTRRILAIDGVKSVAEWVGRSRNGADTFGPHYSEFEVEVGALDGRSQARVLRELRAVLAGEQGAYPGLGFSVNTFLTERIEETIAGFPAALAVNVFGPDLDALDADARAIAARLAAVPGARDVQVQAPAGTPQLTVRVRLERLAALGLSPQDVAEAVQTAFEGTRTGQIFENGRPVDVVAILDPAHRRAPSQVGALPLVAADGTRVQLADVADITMGAGRYKILHSGGKRVQSVTANVDGRDVDAFGADVRAAVASVRLTPGHYAVISGEAEAAIAARETLLFHSALALAGVFVLLYLAFANLRNLTITFLNLPFALVGGVIAVLLDGGWMTLGSLVGFVTLFGITLRNSIMLVSHYEYLVGVEGAPWNRDTMLRGAGERLPSILMTALVTALGLMPLALGAGEPGREIEGPMAMIIVGGLVTSTLLNLLVLPAVLLRFGRFGGGRG